MNVLDMSRYLHHEASSVWGKTMSGDIIGFWTWQGVVMDREQLLLGSSNIRAALGS